jgi:hypothetical protein
MEIRKTQEEKILAHREEVKQSFKTVLEIKEKKDNEKIQKRLANQKIKSEMFTTMKQLRDLKDRQVKEEASLVKEQKKVNFY